MFNRIGFSLLTSVLLLSGFQGFAQSSWANRFKQEIPTTYNFGIAGNANIVIAIGDQGQYISSFDGINWKNNTFEFADHLRAILWTGTQFVAIGGEKSTRKAVTVSSPDGIHWTRRFINSNFNGDSLFKIAGKGSKLIASSMGGRILSTDDGVLWSEQQVGESNESFTALTWAGNQFIAVGRAWNNSIVSGIVYTSVDGTHWEKQKPTRYIFTGHLVFNGNQVMAYVKACDTCGGFSATSQDGKNWPEIAIRPSFDLSNGFVWAGSQYCAIRGERNFLSTDGSTWTTHTWNEPSNPWKDYFPVRSLFTPGTITYAVNRIIAISNFGYILTSSDGLAWTYANNFEQDSYLFSVASSKSLSVAVGVRGKILSSPEGIQWTNSPKVTNSTLTDIIWTGTEFVAVGFSGTILTSSTGWNWVSRNSGTKKNLHSIVWSGKRFVATGENGTLLASIDGISWTLIAAATEKNINAVAWNGSQYIAVGDGVILSSANGLVWNVSNQVSSNLYSSITWSDTQFVAVGVNGYKPLIQTSRDGILWEDQKMEPFSRSSNRLSKVYWVHGNYFAIANQSFSLNWIFTSKDGKIWTPVKTENNNEIYSLAWSGTQFVGVGKSNGIYTSPWDLTTIITKVTKMENYISLHSTPSVLSFVPPLDWSTENTRISIYSLNGNKVLEFASPPNSALQKEWRFPISTLPLGKYMVEAKNQNRNYSRVFLKAK